MQMDLRFWGVVVKPGETVKCDPGELYYHLSQIALEAGKAEENVEVFVKTDDKRIRLCTLSVDNDPHTVTDLVFKKKFELLHSSLNSNICFTGYNFKIVERSNTSTKGDDESDEEVPLLIPLDCNTDGYMNNEATHGANKLTAARPVDAPSSIPKATVEQPTTPGMSKVDDKDRTDAQNPSDGDDIESSEDVDYPRKKTKGEKRSVETPLKTPQGKKAKIETPTTGKKTGYVHVATPYPAKQARKSSDYVHVATPYPAKRYMNNEATHGANKLTAPRPVDAPSSIPKATVEEATSPGMPKGDDKDRTDAQNPSDGDDSENSEDVDYFRKKTKGEKRPVETPLKTPQGKKAKIETPTTGQKTGYVHVATPYPAKQASKPSDYVHVTTPYPARHARKAPESKDKSKQSTPYPCGSCSRSFSSPLGLRDHSKMKHGATD